MKAKSKTKVQTIAPFLEDLHILSRSFEPTQETSYFEFSERERPGMIAEFPAIFCRTNV